MTKIKVIALFVVLGSFLMFLPASCERIDAGHVGIKVNNTASEKGVSKTELVTGWQFYIPWMSQVYEWPTYVQHKEYDTIEVTMKGGTIFRAAPAINYSVISDSVSSIFESFRRDLPEIEDGFLKTCMLESFRSTAGDFTPDSLLMNRQLFENTVRERFIKQVRPKGFLLAQLTSNLTPPPALVESITLKNRAVQNAQTEENKVKISIAQANQKIAVARGDSAQLVIRAQSEAKAYELQQRNLTPELLKKMYLDKWNGTLPSVMTGNGSNMMYNIN
jgi:regulator of protease activity HflC (stomatin/prohibitin superfamily)